MLNDREKWIYRLCLGLAALACAGALAWGTLQYKEARQHPQVSMELKPVNQDLVSFNFIHCVPPGTHPTTKCQLLIAEKKSMSPCQGVAFITQDVPKPLGLPDLECYVRDLDASIPESTTKALYISYATSSWPVRGGYGAVGLHPKKASLEDFSPENYLITGWGSSQTGMGGVCVTAYDALTVTLEKTNYIDGSSKWKARPAFERFLCLSSSEAGFDSVGVAIQFQRTHAMDPPLLISGSTYPDFTERAGYGLSDIFALVSSTFSLVMGGVGFLFLVYYRFSKPHTHKQAQAALISDASRSPLFNEWPHDPIAL